MPRYILMNAAPKLSGKARQYGRNYVKIAVVQLTEGFEGTPAMISERARGVEKIIYSEVIHLGKTERSLGYRQLQAARALVDHLNTWDEIDRAMDRRDAWLAAWNTAADIVIDRMVDGMCRAVWDNPRAD